MSNRFVQHFPSVPFLVFASVFIASALTALTLRAATYTWDPSANRSDTAGSGNWNTTSAIWDNGTADVPWTNGSMNVYGSINSSVFNGTDGAYTVTVNNGIVSGGLTVNASGYTLQGASAASPGSLSLSDANQYGYLDVATGRSMTIGANMTVAMAGSSGSVRINFQDSSHTGTVNVTDGGSLTFGATQSVYLAGNINVGANSTVGNSSASTGIYNGNITMNGANSMFNVRGMSFSNSTLTINQGTFSPSGGSGTSLTKSTVNLNGGTFLVGYFSGSDANSVFNLNGGVFQTNLYGGLYAGPGAQSMKMIVQAGGAKFSLAMPMTISVPLQHDASGPAIDGGLTVSTSFVGGGLTLARADTYTGGTMVVNGLLTVASDSGLGTGDASVLSTAVNLTIGTGVTTPFGNPSAHLNLAGGGTANTADKGYLDLTSGANITVGSLTLGTTLYTSGVFSSANFPEYISGTGTITVVPEPGSLMLTSILILGLGTGLLVHARHGQKV